MEVLQMSTNSLRFYGEISKIVSFIMKKLCICSSVCIGLDQKKLYGNFT